MSIEVIAILLLAFFVGSVIITNISKQNLGIVAMGFAIVLAAITETSWKSLLGNFPVVVVVNLFTVALFFGPFVENGTLNWIARSTVYKLRRFPKLYPFVFFFVSILFGMLGGTGSIIFTCAITIPIGALIKMKPWETGTISLLGITAGMTSPIGQHGLGARAIISTANEGAWEMYAEAISWKMWSISLASCLGIVLVLYVIYKNWNLSGTENIEKPETLNNAQKKSLAVMFSVLILAVLLPNIGKMVSNPVVKSICSLLEIAPLCILGMVICPFLGLTSKDGIKKYVPMDAICMIGGMTALIGLGNSLGFVDYLGSLLAGVPQFMMLPMFAIIAGIMSFFSSALSVVYPSMFPIAGAVALATGMNPVSLFAAAFIGAVLTALSPLSTGGSIMMTVVTDDIGDRNEVFNKMFIMAGFALCIFLAMIACGILNLGGTI